MRGLDVYEILAAEHEAMLQAYILGLVRDPFLTEDICQEAFIQGFRKISTLKNKKAFPSWLRAIARNLALAALRRRGKEMPTDPELLAGMEEVFARFDENLSGSGWEERVRLVAECFERLDDTLKACCSLHYFEGKSVKEAATLLETSLAAALKRLERARLAIARCVGSRLGLEDA